MSSQYINPNVAQVAPSLYTASLNANLNRAQANQVNEVAGTIALNKRLSAMPSSQAQKEWTTLDPHAQEQIKAMYGDAPYIPKPQQNLALKVAKGITSVALSPFRGIFEAAKVYNRVINEPYLVIRQITQGADPFDWDIYKNAWSGKAVYDNGSLQALHQKFGDTDTFVAMKALEGLKPGQIIDAYGRVNDQIIKSLTKMYNDPTGFQQMLDQFKGAQVSVGRDIARVMLNTSPTDNKVYSSKRWNLTSGGIDFFTQILIDPLTWLTGGTSKAITKSEKLGEALARGEKTVQEVFARRDVRNTWDNVAGRLIKDYAKAKAVKSPEGRQRAAEIRNQIGRDVPTLNNDKLINMLADNEIFSAKAAEDFFGQKSDAMLELLSGRVEGTTFFRSGIPIAKKSRVISSGMNNFLGNYFNGNIAKESADKLQDFVGELYKTGIEKDISSITQGPALREAEAGLNSLNRKLGRLAARFPGSEPIGVTDDNVTQSLGTLRALARTIYPKAHADYFAEAFKESNPYDRVILLRGLYSQIMHNMGVHATPGGRQLMENILQDKFGDITSFASRSELYVPPQFAEGMKSRGVLETQPVENVGGMLVTKIDGTLYPFNAKPMIGNLPWSKYGKDEAASLADYAVNAGRGGKIRQIVDGIGGTTARQFTRKLTNAWSIATLFPRLGIRSAIDETFFYLMSAPGEDLFRFALGRKAAKAMTAYTGQEKSIPAMKRAILNALNKNPAKFVSEDKRYAKIIVNGEERYRLETQENIAEEAMKIIEKAVPEKYQKYIFAAMIHDPNMTHSMVNSIVGKTGLGGSLSGDELASMLISNSNLTNMYRELGFAPTGKFEEYSVKELAKVNESAVAAAHFKNFFMRFTKSGWKFDNKFANPGVIFMKHNGLKSDADFAAARDEYLSKIGINPETLEVTNAKALKQYIELSQQAARNQLQGWSDVDTAVHRVEHMFIDMYNTFHGSAIAYNDRLYNEIHDIARVLRDEKQMPSELALREALNSIDYNVFENYTRGFRPEGFINTDLDFSKSLTNESFMQKIVEWADNRGFNPMEWMDAQNNHIFRQPALWATYARYRDKYSNLEEKFQKELIASGINKDLAAELAEKKFTETAMNHAAMSILKYADNPLVRSNLSWSLRTAGRFYRATEDFYRRVFRLKDVAPQVLYRMRLAHLGLQSNGFLHPDENGNPYLIMPGDNIIFHAINGSMAVFGANVKQPLFNEFAVKLALGNPSFQQDAGQPSLSGPFMAVPVLGLQRMVGAWGGDLGKELAKDIDKLVLGNVNQNLTFRKAIVPASIEKVLSMIGLDEGNQQSTSAAMQAIAYNAAHGLFLSPEMINKLPAEERDRAKSDYIKQIKITAHNVVFMRSFLGLISPIAPTMQESKDVPDYLLNAGINGLRPEFADLLQGVIRNSRGKIQDPYEAALMAFTGKYPGKLVYTVARDEKQTNILIAKTKETQSWMLNNAGNIKTYGDAALIFAPNVGAYDSNVYLWMQGAGLLQKRELEDYLDEVNVAQLRQEYFDMRTQAENAMNDPALNLEQRRQVLDVLKYTQDNMKATYPLLDQALNSKSYGIGKQEAMFDSIRGIISDKKFPMSDSTRNKMGIAINLVNKGLDAIKNTDFTQVVDDAGYKRQVKAEVLNAIYELGGAEGRKRPQDPVLAEAIRSVFEPMLDYYVRNTLKVGQ